MLGGGDDDVPCMCAHVRCYATVALLLHTCEMLRNSCFVLAHMFDATQLMGWVGRGWDGDVSCMCTHVRCYATDWGELGGVR